MLYYVEFLAAPLCAVFLYLLSSSDYPLSVFVLGVIAWTFAEYLVHRMLHVRKHPSHHAHHAEPQRPIPELSKPIWLCFGLAYLVLGGAFTAGALVAYTWYLYVHECAHHRHTWIPRALLNHHTGHHRVGRFNFGVSCTFWDDVFRTRSRYAYGIKTR